MSMTMNSLRFRMLSLQILFIPLHFCTANDTLTQGNQVSVGQTLTSANQLFELGFFSPGNSTQQYIGIWYKKRVSLKPVWLANRENPLSNKDTNAHLTIGTDGNLKLVDGGNKTIWSTTNVSIQSNNTIAVLSNKGDLTLSDNVSGLVLWESFGYPGDTLLPGMRVGTNMKTGNQYLLSSWQTDGNPSLGTFIVGLSAENPPQAFIWNGSKPHWRSGPWDGGKFIGVTDVWSWYGNGINVNPDDPQGGAYLTTWSHNPLGFIFVLTPDGHLKIMSAYVNSTEWSFVWQAPDNPCDIYGACGPFGICKKDISPMCECLYGFEPKSIAEWGKRNWTSGCVRRTTLSCALNESNFVAGKPEIDGYFNLSLIKLPDMHILLALQDEPGCQHWCSSNCSCTAYAFMESIGCLVWIADLMDIEQLSSSRGNLFVRLAPSELGKVTKRGKKAYINIIIISLTTTLAILLLICSIYSLCKWRAHKRGRRCTEKDGNLNDRTVLGDALQEDFLKQETSELPMFDFDKIAVATENFSKTNKLGEGGFGPVFKGMLDNGQQIAVKRLSSRSGQGIEEFKNEILLISKLQHRNLVKLLGCCIEGEEKLLIYEYMTNKSLDTFLFDPKKRLQLDWAARFNIIQGIARGLLYLHRDSCLRIIHRDLKSNNILLDDKMNPKISDFGLARTFQLTQELANTHRIVGTYGYMSPEYAMRGVISEKSDVFSFGVMLLEIVSSKKNTSFILHEESNLIAYAWKLWAEGRGMDLIDKALAETCFTSQVLRCMHMGLLCVQDFPEDRPTISAVVQMLSSETALPEPKQPLFTVQRMEDRGIGMGSKYIFSINEITVSVNEGR